MGRIIYNRHQTGDGKKRSSLLPRCRAVVVFKAEQGGRCDGDGWAQGRIYPLRPPGITGGSQDKQILGHWFLCSAGSFVPARVISRGDQTAIKSDEMLLPDLDKNHIALHQVYLCKTRISPKKPKPGIWGVDSQKGQGRQKQDVIPHFPNISVHFSQLRT